MQGVRKTDTEEGTRKRQDRGKILTPGGLYGRTVELTECPETKKLRGSVAQSNKHVFVTQGPAGRLVAAPLHMCLIRLPLGSSEPANQIHLKPMTEAQGQDQLREAFQAPSRVSSAHIQAAQMGHTAEPRSREIRAPFCGGNSGLSRGPGEMQGGELRAVIDCAVSAQKLFAISYSRAPNLLKGGPL